MTIELFPLFHPSTIAAPRSALVDIQKSKDSFLWEAPLFIPFNHLTLRGVYDCRDSHYMSFSKRQRLAIPTMVWPPSGGLTIVRIAKWQEIVWNAKHISQQWKDPPSQIPIISRHASQLFVYPSRFWILKFVLALLLLAVKPCVFRMILTLLDRDLLVAALSLSQVGLCLCNMPQNVSFKIR